MSPIWTTERDVPETDGTDGRHRRMSLRWKTKTDGPSVFMSFHLRDISFEWCVCVRVQRCVSLVDDSSGSWVGGCVVGWVCIGACAGAGGRKSMSSGGIYFGLLNRSHSVDNVMN